MGDNLIGYARVSTGDQNPDLQHDALTAVGCTRVFSDTASGALDKRPQLDALQDYLRSGDVLVVWRLDRLGRSVRHLTETVNTLAERGVGFRSPASIAASTACSEPIVIITSLWLICSLMQAR